MTDASGADGGALHPTISVDELPEDQRRELAEADAAVAHTLEAVAAADAGRESAQRKIARADEDMTSAHLAVEHAQADFEQAQADHDAAVQRRAGLGGGQ